MKKGFLWPAVIVSALAIHVVVSLVVVFIATSDPSYAVEEDYYQKAINWDEKRAQDRTNENLDWNLEFSVSPPEQPGEQPKVELTLENQLGLPLTGAAVSIETFYNSLSGDILRAHFPATDESGRSEITLPMKHNGRWELRFTAQHNGETFTHSEIRHLFVLASPE